MSAHTIKFVSAQILMRKQSQVKAEKAYQATVDRVIIRFKKDCQLWAWVRSQVTHQSEIPAYIKQVLEKEKNAAIITSSN